MSDRMPIERTRKYMTAYAEPVTEEEKEFLSKYREVYRLWQESGDLYYLEELTVLDESSTAVVIYDREYRKQLEKDVAECKAWEEAKRQEELNAILQREREKKAKLKKVIESKNGGIKLEEKKQTGKAVLWVILYFVISTIIVLVATVVLSIILGAIGISDLFARTVAVLIGYFGALFIVLWLGDLNTPTEKLFHKVVGIIVVIVHTISLLSNLINEANIWLNIVQLGLGIRFLLMSRD